MDIEKLVKDLLVNSDPDGLCIEDDLMQDAATALSTLQAENEKRQDELEQARAEITRLKHYEDKCHDCLSFAPRRKSSRRTRSWKRYKPNWSG